MTFKNHRKARRGKISLLDLLQKSIPFALSLSKGVCRTCSSALRQAQGERNDGAKTTYARGLLKGDKQDNQRDVIVKFALASKLMHICKQIFLHGASGIGGRGR